MLHACVQNEFEITSVNQMTMGSLELWKHHFVFTSVSIVFFLLKILGRPWPTRPNRLLRPCTYQSSCIYTDITDSLNVINKQGKACNIRRIYTVSIEIFFHIRTNSLLSIIIADRAADRLHVRVFLCVDNESIGRPLP